MKKKIVALTIALIMLIGMQVFATTGLPLTPNNGQSGVGTGTGSTTGVGTSTTATPAPTGTITPTTGSASTTTPTPVSSTGTTSSTSSEAPVVSSTTKPETSLPKAGTSNVVLYGVSVLSVVAIVLYRKITK